MNKKTPLIVISSTVKGTKLVDGKEVNNTSDGQDHSLNTVFPFFAKPKSPEEFGKAVTQWIKDLEEASASKRVVGLVDDQELDTAIGTAPVGDKETAIDVAYAATTRGFSLLYQPPMNKALMDKWVPKSSAAGTRTRAKKAFDPSQAY